MGGCCKSARRCSKLNAGALPKRGQAPCTYATRSRIGMASAGETITVRLKKTTWNFWGICKDWICQREAMQLCSFKLPVRQNCSAEVREGEAVYSWLTKVRHFEAPGIQLLPPCQLSQNEWKIHGNARKAQGSCLKRSTRSWFVTSQEVDGWFMMNLKMMMPSDLPGAVAYSQSSCCNYLHPQRRYKPSESSACAEPAKLSFITLSWCHWYSSNQ